MGPGCLQAETCLQCIVTGSEVTVLIVKTNGLPCTITFFFSFPAVGFCAFFSQQED
jgi:hypothetical protein